MKPNLITSNSIHASTSLTHTYPIPFPRPSKSLSYHSISLPLHLFNPCRCTPICFSKPTKQSNSINEVLSDSYVESDGRSNGTLGEEDLERNLNMQVGNQIVPSFIQPFTKFSSTDQAFFLLSFIACTTSVAFTSLVIAAIPTLNAMRRAATSLSKLADTAREELPSTMASIRLSGMEISDLTLELSDLSQEIADGVKKSAQAVQAAEAGVRQIGALAHQHTICAAKKTSNAVGQATKNLMNMISRGELRTENEDSDGIERVDI
ncbi:uncharacterized protein [Euphorbia lathyris]|uniref:uncharacterized protein isoform X2 n=1 Tax=Euphorbia lathyris TaxID=212925 RepID=UPI0033138D3D